MKKLLQIKPNIKINTVQVIAHCLARHHYRSKWKTSLILSPNIFEILDRYPDTDDVDDQTFITPSKENNMADDEPGPTDLLLHRVLKKIDTLSDKIDSHNIRFKDIEDKLYAIESWFTSVDVKLDINNMLISSVIDCWFYARTMRNFYKYSIHRRWNVWIRFIN